ncbi:C4BPA-like protein, partial [Mya arenaria]
MRDLYAVIVLIKLFVLVYGRFEDCYPGLTECSGANNACRYNETSGGYMCNCMIGTEEESPSSQICGNCDRKLDCVPKFGPEGSVECTRKLCSCTSDYKAVFTGDNYTCLAECEAIPEVTGATFTKTSGFVTSEQVAVVGAVLTYACNDGYSPTDSNLFIVICNDQGAWSNTPKCVKECEAIPEVTGATFTKTSGFVTSEQVAVVGAVLTYACNDGYSPTDSNLFIVICNDQGAWSNTPKCVKECEAIPEVTGATFTKTSGFVTSEQVAVVGAVFTYACNDGYSPTDSNLFIVICNDQ